MKTLHITMIISVVIISIVVVLIMHTPPQSRCQEGILSNGICAGPRYDISSTENIIDEQKARSLAESYVDELKVMSYGCQFQSVSGIYGTDSSGTSKLNAVQVGYTCTSRYVGAFVILEDPQLTKVLNVTTFPSSRFGS